MEYMEIAKIAIPLLAIGGAWGGARHAINGTVKRVDKLEDRSDRTIDRLARIETKIDILVENK
jgi:hypothetical protein